MLRTLSTDRTPAGNTFANAVTTSGSPTISGLTFNDTSPNEIRPGYWVTIDNGFPSTTRRFEVISTNSGAGTIQVERGATSSETGVNVITKPDMYTDGDGGNYGRTVINARERNIHQEELVNLIEDAGLTLDDDDHGQISAAVVKTNGDQMTGTLEMLSENVIKTDIIERQNAGFPKHLMINSIFGIRAQKITALTAGKLQCDVSQGNMFELNFATPSPIEIVFGGLGIINANTSFLLYIVNISAATHTLPDSSPYFLNGSGAITANGTLSLLVPASNSNFYETARSFN